MEVAKYTDEDITKVLLINKNDIDSDKRVLEIREITDLAQ